MSRYRDVAGKAYPNIESWLNSSEVERCRVLFKPVPTRRFRQHLACCIYHPAICGCTFLFDHTRGVGIPACLWPCRGENTLLGREGSQQTSSYMVGSVGGAPRIARVEDVRTTRLTVSLQANDVLISDIKARRTKH